MANIILHTSNPPQVGFNYRRVQLTGQTVSYAVYDDGWNLANGVYDYLVQPNPLYTQDLDTSSPTPLLTLKYPNAFGTYDRFTEEDGTKMDKNVGGIQYYIIDHLTGLMWLNNLGVRNSFDNNMGVGGIIEGITTNGFSDWRSPNKNEIASLQDNGWNRIFPGSPYLLDNLLRQPLFTSTTFGIGQTNTIFKSSGIDTIFQQALKTDTSIYGTIVRTYYP